MSLIFRDDAYARKTEASVVASGPDGIRLDRTVFYPMGGGQPGDVGVLRWPGGTVSITDTRKGADLVQEGPDVLHIPALDTPLPPPGTVVEAEIDWDRRYRHMRMHTALHLLCAVVPGAVTGGQVGAERSRLDFDVPGSSLDRNEIEAQLNRLVAGDHPVIPRFISETDLAAQPELVRTLSVQPPMGGGTVRLLCIGASDAPIDLQPCGGTHVARTGEISRVQVAKIENKGKQNRRIVVALEA